MLIPKKLIHQIFMRTFVNLKYDEYKNGYIFIQNYINNIKN